MSSIKLSMMSITRELVCSIVIFLFVLECGRTVQLTGGASEETNARVSGKVVDASGRAAANAFVQLIPVAYDPVDGGALPDSLTAITDTGGRYRIHAADTGTYNIQAFQSTGRTRSLVWNVRVSGDSAVAPVSTLRDPGTIKLAIPDSAHDVNGYVYIPGTTITASVNGSGTFLFLDSVPPGNVPPAVYEIKNNSSSARIISDAATVASGDTTTIAYSAWKSSQKLYLNTTSSGANVQSTLLGFPVLVRLTQNNFNFAAASSNGNDIRFAKANGTPLSYEIEQWDVSAGQAAVWVRVDTVYGNDSTHFIIMFWGNPNVAGGANSGAVFDTSSGFQGVWHLGRPDGSIELDATYNHFDATPSDTGPIAAAGQIGVAKKFDGVSTSFDVKNSASGKLNFPEMGTYTISAWVYSDTLNDSSHLIVGKGNQQYYLKQKFTPNLDSQTWEFVEYQTATGWQITDYQSSPKAWTYLCGVRSNGNQYLYVNGILVNSTPGNNPPIQGRDTSQDVTIGKYLQFVTPSGEGYCPFKGVIDEVRISSISQSADWIKLEYMNQKVPGALVVFK